MKTNLKKQSKKYPKEYEVRHIKEQELEKTALSFLKDVNEIDVYNGNYMDNLINAHETIGEVFLNMQSLTSVKEIETLYYNSVAEANYLRELIYISNQAFNKENSNE